MAADSAQGATLVAGTSSSFTTAVKPRTLTVEGKSIALLETTTLSTTGTKTAVKADLFEREKVNVTIFYDPNEPPPVGISETWTLTYPIPTGMTNGATKAGTAVCTREGHSLMGDVLMEGDFTIEFTGATTNADAT
jgi:hypothetical protein